MVVFSSVCFHFGRAARNKLRVAALGKYENNYISGRLGDRCVAPELDIPPAMAWNETKSHVKKVSVLLQKSIRFYTKLGKIISGFFGKNCYLCIRNEDNGQPCGGTRERSSSG